MQEDEYTISQEMIKVDETHTLYSQLWGNKDSKPIIVVNGGPGGASKDRYKGLYNPKNHLVLFFDQRGAGQSLPYGELKNNTTQQLADDITKLADHYGFDKFALLGGSWGSCLSLVYAIQNPDRVDELFLDGIFTGTKQEIDYVEYGGFKTHYPDNWQEYQNSVPEEFRSDPARYHHPRILEGSNEESKESAFAHSALESNLLSLDNLGSGDDFEVFDLVPDKILTQYMVNNCFLEDGYILSNANKIKARVNLIQGRYDMVCPPITAFELNEALPDSQLIWTVAGHVDRTTLDVKKALIQNYH